MDGIVHTIENAAANVDGTAIAEKAVDSAVAVEAANGETPVADGELPEAKRFKEDTATATAAKEESAPEANGDAKDAPETMEVDGEKKEEEPVVAAEKDSVKEDAPVPPSTTTTTIADTTTATPTEETPSVAVAVEAVAPAVETPAAESTNEVTSTEAAVEETEEKMDTAETPAEEEKTPETDKPVTEEPAKEAVAEQSVIELDSTVDTTAEPKANPADEQPTAEVVTIEDSVTEAKEPETETPAVAEENVATEAPAVTVDAPSEMEVTMEEPEAADKTLETPNVSMQPPLLANNRISELVLSNGSSTPNTSNPKSVEFQATPIKKAPIEESLPSTDEKSTDDSSVQEHAQESSSDDGGIKRLQETLKQVNGTTTTDCSSAGEAEVEKHLDLTEESSVSLNPEDQIYETVINFQNGLLQCLYVERVTRSAATAVQLSHNSGSDAASEKSASNGSATSLGPFTLPNVLTNTASGLSVSSQGSITGEKGRIQGVSGLRTFLQDLLKKLPEEKKKAVGRPSKGRASSSTTAAANTAATSTAPAVAAKEAPSTPTRATAASTASPKTTATESSAKKQVAFAATTESVVGNFVMARWSDKKYYAGRVTAEKPGHKFQVHFEDGAQRTLARDQLVFGDKSVAQSLLNRVCNVLVEANIYETGLVVEIDADACTYKVVTDSVTVTVPATDIYLDEEQAKACRDADTTGAAASSATETPATATTPSTTTSGRRKRTSDVTKSSPEAGPSTAGVPAAKKSRKRQPPPPPLPQIQSCDSQLSDLSDTFESEPAKPPEVSYVEAVEGVQPELFNCPVQAKIKETCGYRDYQNAEQLGPLPTNSALFRNKYFILTAPEVTNRASPSDHNPFSDLPFDMEYLCQQLRYGGATIYEHFEEIPKSKYKTCILITKAPCLTARYIQCLAVNMLAVSHGWVIESCRQNKLAELKAFALPAGWSMAENNFVRYVTGRNERRANAHPFMQLHILISSENEEFINFWTRVCKFGDAKTKTISSVLDITVIGKNRTYLLTDSDLIVANVEKAKSLGIPVVSTAWVFECLIQGKNVSPYDHPNFTKANWDDIHN